MAGRVAFDTTFLIDLDRELGRGKTDGPAHRYLARDADLELYLSTTALGEFAEGFEDEDAPAVMRVRKQYTLLPSDTQTALTYSRIARTLRSEGRLIGVNDLWIAAASLRNDLPLVTANTAEFSRVEGLEVMGYR